MRPLEVQRGGLDGWSVAKDNNRQHTFGWHFKFEKNLCSGQNFKSASDVELLSNQQLLKMISISMQMHCICSCALTVPMFFAEENVFKCVVITYEIQMLLTFEPFFGLKVLQLHTLVCMLVLAKFHCSLFPMPFYHFSFYIVTTILRLVKKKAIFSDVNVPDRRFPRCFNR